MHRRISSKSLRVLAAGVTATATLTVVGATGHAAGATATPTGTYPTVSPAGLPRGERGWEGPAETERRRGSQLPAAAATAGWPRCTHTPATTPATARATAADPAP
ncbi:hypothetical protein ACFSL4_03565 [Streptomyces caeni]|uniref:Uncharacterized protein n=1 Tax=Streptomyces caeni TaxID=2307231 RepID=A0ABW4IJ30_9ACTN